MYLYGRDVLVSEELTQRMRGVFTLCVEYLPKRRSYPVHSKNARGICIAHLPKGAPFSGQFKCCASGAKLNLKVVWGSTDGRSPPVRRIPAIGIPIFWNVGEAPARHTGFVRSVSLFFLAGWVS